MDRFRVLAVRTALTNSELLKNQVFKTTTSSSQVHCLLIKNPVCKVIKRFWAKMWHCLMHPEDGWWWCRDGLRSRTGRNAFKHSTWQTQRLLVSPVWPMVCSILLLKARVTDETEKYQRWTAGWGAEKTVVLRHFPGWQKTVNIALIEPLCNRNSYGERKMNVTSNKIKFELSMENRGGTTQ